MASSPNIPTSFLPHAGSPTSTGSTNAVVDIIAYLSFVVSGAIFVLAIGVFLYGQLLVKTKLAKDAELSKAVSALNVDTVPSFVRLHDRLSSGMTLIGKHVSFTGFFPVLEAALPSTIRLNSLHLTLDADGNPKFLATGEAQSFNSLAVASAVLSKDPHFKGALFSGIQLKGSTVAFSLASSLDPKIITFSP